MLHLAGAGQKASRTTGLITGATDYTCVVRVRFNAQPALGEYFTPFTLKNNAYDKYAGLFTDFSRVLGVWQASAGGGPFIFLQQYFFKINHWHAIGYVRSGATHLFYVDGYFVGSGALDLSSVVWDEILIGDDGFGAPNFDVAGFREFDRALWTDTDPQFRAAALIFEWNSAAAVAVTPFTDTPLLTDANDISGNAHHWTLSGGASITAGPTPYPHTIDHVEVTTGSMTRLLYFPFDRHLLIYVTVGQVGIAAMVYRLIVSTTTGIPGTDTLVAFSFAIDCYYKSAGAWILAGTVTDPWVNPLLGVPYPSGTISAASFQAPPHRLAISVRSSDVDILTLTTYTANAVIRYYLDDVEVVSAVNVTIAAPEPFRGVGLGYDHSAILDRVWERRYLYLPNTDSEGVPQDPTDDAHDFLYYDDFTTGILPVWSPFSGIWNAAGNVPTLSVSPAFPFVKPDVGGNQAQGLSVLDLTFLQVGSLATTPRRAFSGIFRLIQLMLGLPGGSGGGPIPPPPIIPPAACPVNLLPTAILPPPACPVDLDPSA